MLTAVHPAAPTADAPEFGPKPEYLWLNVGSLRIDDAYQRLIATEDAQRVIKRIAENFTWRDFLAVVVGKRDDRTLWVIDGQHRLEAAKRLGIINVPCLIFPYDSIAEEAQTFVAINRDRRRVDAVDLFLASLTAGDEEAEALDEVFQDAGVKVTRFRNTAKFAANEITCVTACQQALKKHGRDALRDALIAIVEAYADLEQRGLYPTEHLVRGVTAIYAEFRTDERFDPDRLIAAIRKMKPVEWADAGRQFCKLLNVKPAAGMRAAIVRKYNERLPQPKRLAEFSGEGVAA